MRNHLKFLLFFGLLILAALACQTVDSLDPNFTPNPAYYMQEQTSAAELTSTFAPSLTPEPTETPEEIDVGSIPTVTAPAGSTPEDVNAGQHLYYATKTEMGCPLTLSASEMIITINFSGTQVEIFHPEGSGYETYDFIGDHRYLRYNSVDAPIVVVFNMGGYVLQVFPADTDVETAQPCGYFTYLIID